MMFNLFVRLFNNTHKDAAASIISLTSFSLKVFIAGI